MWYDEGNKLIGHLVTHVDDFVFGGTENWQKQVIDKLKRTFKISIESQGSFKYIGLNAKQSNDCIKIEQRGYIVSIDRYRSNRLIQRKKTAEGCYTDKGREKKPESTKWENDVGHKSDMS
jgi:hypothetical protein